MREPGTRAPTQPAIVRSGRLVAVVVCIGLPVAWLAARNRTEIEHWRSYWLKRLTPRNTK